MTEANDERFEQQAKALFDDSVDRLDAATLSKLNQGRQAALAELSTSRSRAEWVRWAPATGLAAAALVAVVMLRGPAPVDTPTINGAAAATDFEILIGEDSLEMIEELEFYSWLDVADAEVLDNVG
ncbi:MAG: hypothetical protein QNJ00_02585 [Woeseiaceae bacterium]|nr:hypothetical protein [Woeseiaceae bacterium]